MRKFLISALALLVSSSAFGATNLLESWNPGFERSTTKWTASGGTFTTTTAAANRGEGTASGSWDSSAAAQTLTSTGISVTSGDGASGRDGVVSCSFKAVSGSATHKLQAYSGSSVIAEATITSSTSKFVTSTVNFPFPASGTVYLRVVSVASNEPELFIDSCYLGLAEGFNVITASTITAWTSFTPTGSWTVNTTYTGKWRQVGDTMELEVKVALSGAPNATPLTINMPTGYTIDTSKLVETQYRIVGAADIRDYGVANFDGIVEISTSNTAVSVRVSETQYTYGTNQPVTATAPMVFGNTDYVFARFSVPVANWVAEQAYHANKIIDFTGIVMVTPLATCPSNTIEANGAAVSRTAYSKLFAKIGTTHGYGDNSTTFNIPDYRGRFLRGVDGGVGNDPDRASRTAMATGGNTGDNVGSVQGDQNVAHRHKTGVGAGSALNGWQFDAGSTSIAGTAAGAYGFLYTPDGGGGNEARPKNANVKYCVVYDGTIQAPLLVGSVTSSSTGSERTERVIWGGSASGGVPTSVCSSTPCTIVQGTPAVTSVTRSGVGTYTINFASGTFSTVPTCTFSAGWNGVVSTGWAGPAGPTTSSTAMSLISLNSSNAAADYVVSAICVGPR